MGCGNTKQKTEVFQPFFEQKQKEPIQQKNKNSSSSKQQQEKIKFQQNNVQVVSIDDNNKSNKQPQTFKQNKDEVTSSQRNSILTQNKQIKNLQISEGIIIQEQQRKSNPQNDIGVENLQNQDVGNCEDHSPNKRQSISSQRRGSSQIEKLKELIQEEKQQVDDGAKKLKERRASAQANQISNNIEVNNVTDEEQHQNQIEIDHTKQHKIQIGFSSNPQQNVRRASRASEFGKQSGRQSLQSQGSQQGFQTQKQSQFMEIKKID